MYKNLYCFFWGSGVNEDKYGQFQMLSGKSNKSVIRIFLFSMLLITIISTAVIGYSWVRHERGTFVSDSEKLREEYIASRKSLIKNEVDKVMDYIHYVRSGTDQRLRQHLKEEVVQAHGIALAIYNKYRNKRSVPVIKEMIKSALNPIRFNNGRGYFFIYRMSGILELYPAKPQNEGKNHFNLRDKQGVYVVREEIDLIKQQKEGFLIRAGTGKIGNNVFSGSLPKISFVKYFQPFDWYIGSKEYREDFELDIQREVLERIDNIRFGDQKEGYIFVFTYDGVTLVNDTGQLRAGHDQWESEDTGGTKIVRGFREIIDKQGGGYFEYTWNKPPENTLAPKVSYVKGLKDWRWMVGTGVYLDAIDTMIAEKKLALEQNVKSQILKIVILFVLIILVVIVITLIFSRRLRREFEVFMAFFRKSALSHEPIDRDKLFADEFKTLADGANDMLKERQVIENSLRESEERLAVTFRSIGDGVITTDIHGRVVLMNRVAEQWTGWSRTEAQGKTLNDVFDIRDEDTGKPLESPVERTLNTGEIAGLAGHSMLFGRDGSQRLITDSSAPIRDMESRIIGAVMVFQNVTEKRVMEEELRKSQKLESLGVLAGGIAHDFNNLLTAVLGNINLAKEEMSPVDKPYDALVLAENATLQTRKLTQQLLTFAKGGVPIKKVHDISELIRESVTFSLRGSKVKSHFSVPGQLWPVEVDQGQMNQVLNNLLINAAQAMPDGGVVLVSAANAGPEDGEGENNPLPQPLDNKRYVKIMVRDTGVGIPPEQLPKIFDPYFTTKETGSGLGLASAYSIISKHDGYIDAESRPGEGSVFTVYIPASGEKVSVTLQPGFMNKELPVKGNGKVLVMDDDKMVGDIVRRQLTHLGYQSEIAHEGHEAIRLYRKALDKDKPFDAVLMDLTIPGGLGGAETVKKLLKIDPHVRAIVSSGYSNDPIMADFENYGFTNCIVKPYKLQELSQTLHQVMNGVN
ncbi:MAG: PAS domain S-box protein [bacterium]|nr:PAS domain S-box protein [bacterium]